MSMISTFGIFLRLGTSSHLMSPLLNEHINYAAATIRTQTSALSTSSMSISRHSSSFEFIAIMRPLSDCCIQSRTTVTAPILC